MSAGQPQQVRIRHRQQNPTHAQVLIKRYRRRHHHSLAVNAVALIPYRIWWTQTLLTRFLKASWRNEMHPPALCSPNNIHNRQVCRTIACGVGNQDSGCRRGAATPLSTRGCMEAWCRNLSVWGLGAVAHARDRSFGMHGTIYNTLRQEQHLLHTTLLSSTQHQHRHRPPLPHSINCLHRPWLLPMQ